MPMTKPPVGWPTSLPRPSVRKALRENLGIAVGAIVDEQHERLGPFAVVGTQHRALAAVALAEEGVLLGRRGS